MILVDKPDRTQAQLRIGHLALRYGDPDTAALAIAEAVFGGMFSSRLMQEIRVKRGWSYGAGCALRRSRLPHWFEIWTAAGIDVAGPARRAHARPVRRLRRERPDRRRGRLRAQLPRRRDAVPRRDRAPAHAARGARRGVRAPPPATPPSCPRRSRSSTAADVRAACERHLRPDDAVTVAVTTAEQAQDALAAANAGTLTVVDHDEY